jgi:glycosyltransferase involved in cell wall biosynthesis
LDVLLGWRSDRGVSTSSALPDCSLIVPTYERPLDVVHLLDVVSSLPDQPGEVIVVDGSAGDSTERDVKRWAGARSTAFDLVLIRSPAGLTRQRNIGIDASSSRFVFFLDDDSRPEPGYFEAIRNVFVDSDEGVGGVMGTCIHPGGYRVPLRTKLRRLLRLVPGQEAGRFYSTATSAPHIAPGFTGSRPVEVMPGYSMAFRREVLERHRFSYFFDGYSQGEDLEMSRRVASEFRLLWCGDALVEHRPAKAGRPPAFAKGKMEVRNRCFIWRRHVPRRGVRNRIRFWSDVAFGFAYDCVLSLRGPSYVWHAAGIAAGAWSCLLDPPDFEEPLPGPEFRFSISGVVTPSATE